MRHESTERSVLLFFLLLSFAFAFLTSMVLLFGFSDVWHDVENIWNGYIRQTVQTKVGNSVVEFSFFMVFPSLSVLAFMVERTWRLEWTFGPTFLILGTVSVLWGALHLWNAFYTYSRGFQMAVAKNVFNASGPLSTIYETYGMLVGLPWVLTGILLLVFAYKDLAHRSTEKL